MTTPVHILVTNDDGVNAPGLLALAQALSELGQVSILAPDRNWSASGHVKTLHRPLRVREVELPGGIKAFSSDGAPSDCVALAVLGLLPGKIDLVVSGINPNANLGHDVTYSGTVTAAMEAAIWHIPGIAVSLDSPRQKGIVLDYSTAAQVGKRVAQAVLENCLPDGVVLNVNVPYRPFAELQGLALTRQGLRVYRDELVVREDPHGSPYYWIGGEAPTGVPDSGTDFGALAGGYVSVTPLHLDLTAHFAHEGLRKWDWNSLRLVE